jgi:hypothetical protein
VQQDVDGDTDVDEDAIDPVSTAVCADDDESVRRNGRVHDREPDVDDVFGGPSASVVSGTAY